ncbi:MAG: hypothetical protein IKT42_02460 [Clostridia bacterium]|nr:hypothetical protein [Clostridia bacterium]
MNNLVVITALFSVLIFLLALFSIFAIGFLVGFKIEDKKLRREKSSPDLKESEKEKKAKKEWRKFLEYDGSAPQEEI